MVNRGQLTVVWWCWTIGWQWPIWCLITTTFRLTMMDSTFRVRESLNLANEGSEWIIWILEVIRPIAPFSFGKTSLGACGPCKSALLVPWVKRTGFDLENHHGFSPTCCSPHRGCQVLASSQLFYIYIFFHWISDLPQQSIVRGCHSSWIDLMTNTIILECRKYRIGPYDSEFEIFERLYRDWLLIIVPL